ncbi:ribonuclease H-like domain-containing protein [Tanacetum coccineum]
MPQKEETFQVIIDYTIKKVQDTNSYEFLLANKKCTVNVEVFRTILNICLRVEVKDFIDVLNDETALTFLIDLCYQGSLNRHTNILITGKKRDQDARICHIPNDGVVSRLKFVRIGKDYRSVLNDDTMSAPKSKPATSKTNLKGAPSLTPATQEAINIMQALKESKKTSRRQPGTRVSNEGTDSKPGVLDESTVVYAVSSEGTSIKPGVPNEDKDITEEKVIHNDDHVSDTQDVDDEDIETESDANDIYKYKIQVRKDEDEEMKDAGVKGSDKGDEEITDTAKKDAKKTSEANDDTKKIEFPPSSSSLSVSSALAVLQSYVPTVIDSYLETKVGDHLPELTKKPTATTEQESEKGSSEILKIKKEQAESQKNSHFTIKSAEKADLEEYDLKSALYQSMHANKSFNINPTNHRLYHTLMETLIEDENAMDKGVADTVKDHKRKHDDNEDNDNEHPPAGPNQGSDDENPPPPLQQTPTQHAPHTVLRPKTAKEILARERERKARTTLLMALLEDHLLKFHKITDAKEMWDAIKSRFGGNDESKKMQKYILKQQFKGFSVSNSEGLHKGYDRFQSLLSQLEIHGACVSTEDANQKFLRSLPSSWSQVFLVTRTKPGVESLSFDDLYNILRVFESDVKGSTGSSSSAQNVAFVSSESTSSTNDVSTAYGVSTSSGYNSQSGPHLDPEDLEQLDEFNLEDMDLKWQVAMILMRLKKFYKKTGKRLQFDAKEPVGFDKTKVECYNCHITGHFAIECRSKGNQDCNIREFSKF